MLMVDSLSDGLYIPVVLFLKKVLLCSETVNNVTVGSR